MTGVVGGQMDEAAVDSLLSLLYQESWYDRDKLTNSMTGFGVLHHGDQDPEGARFWQDNQRIGILYGTITNSGALNGDLENLFECLLSEPQYTLQNLDGPFLVAAADSTEEKVVVGTDKLSTRQCYYTSDPFAFGTNVGALASLTDKPSVDYRGISDLLLIGHVWGEKTLVDTVSFLPSGSVLIYTPDTGVSVTQYWSPSFSRDGARSYMDGVESAYRNMISRTAETVSGELGFWLSGGLDSRAMAALMAGGVDEMVTYTYDANPATGSNLKYAKEVAENIGVENVQTELTPDRFERVFADCVELTDGMVGMTTFSNLAASFDLPRRSSVLMEACGQGGLMGDGIGQSVIEGSHSPEQALYRGKHRIDINDARRVLATDFDPMNTYREVVRDSDQPSSYGVVMESYYRNYFPRCDFASNPIPRSQAGTRVPFADSEFLSAVTKMPLSDRAGSIPFTNGKIPAGTAYPKLELIRRINDGLENITYERTKIQPNRPLWQHAVGFVIGTAFDRIREGVIGDVVTYGGTQMMGEWYRNNDRFRRRIDSLLASAADRSYFNADAIEELRIDTRNRDPERISGISGVVTGEQWVQTHLD